jgi:threonine dehydrogenase-like Zn-dependent dehydrogenase
VLGRARHWLVRRRCSKREAGRDRGCCRRRRSWSSWRALGQTNGSRADYRHEPHSARQKIALEFGATDIVTERSAEGVARIKELSKGIGADSVLECVGTEESMMQAIQSTRPGGHIGYVGVPHGVELNAEELFYTHVHLHGGPAPVRRYLPELIDLVLNETINPGKIFDLVLPLDQVAEGYRAMDERRAIKTLLEPQ